MKDEKEIQERWKSKFQRGFLRVIIFHLYHQRYKTNKLLNGNAIRELIENHTSGKWNPSPGSVYPILAELEKDGIIEEKITDNQKNKEYHLTEFGYNLFDKLAEETLAFNPSRMSQHNVHSTQFKERFLRRFSKMSTRDLKQEYERHKAILALMEEMLQEKILTDPQLD